MASTTRDKKRDRLNIGSKYHQGAEALCGPRSQQIRQNGDFDVILHRAEERMYGVLQNQSPFAETAKID